VATAITAFFTLLLAYGTYSTPDALTNDAVDDVLIKRLRRPFIWLRRKGNIRSLAMTANKSYRKARVDYFTSFLMAVSDQIMVSQISVLIAAAVQNQSIAIYSVNVIITLCILASTVHLETFPLLVQHIGRQLFFKTVRVFLTVCGSIMLIVFLIFQLSSSWDNGQHVFFKCAVKDWHQSKEAADYWLNFIISAAVPVIVAWSTIEVVHLLYYRPSRRQVSSDNRDEGLVERANSPPSNPEYDDPYIAIKLRRLRWRRWKVLQHMARDKTLRNNNRGFRYYRFVEKWAFHESCDSFARRLTWLLMANVFGINALFTVRSRDHDMSGNPNEMGFGQIVPLALLILPITSALQNYAGRPSQQIS
jgi:hypothetical protein